MKNYLLLLVTLIICQNLIAINPIREYRVKPDQFRIEYEEIKIDTPDGYHLNTWVMQPEVEHEKNLVFIIAGSDAGNMGFSLAYAFQLLRAGFKVVTFDYRGFGQSSDFDFDPNAYYHREYITDFVTVLDWVKKEETSAKIGVMAFSMGTLIAAAGFEQSKFDLLIGEGLIKSASKNVKRIHELKGKKLNLSKRAKKDSRQINRLAIPILLFASTTDKITTLADSEAIAAKASNRKVISYQGEHLRGTVALGMKEYFKGIIDFVDKWD